RNPMPGEPARPLGAAGLPHDDAADVRRGRLAPVVGNAVVADHRRGEADDLPAEARIGRDLLIAGHPGREHGLAEPGHPCADALPPEHRAVLEREEGRHAWYATRPAATVISTFPWSFRPSSQELAERDRKRSSLTRQVAPGLSRTRFAGAPTAIRGSSRPKIRAGPADIRSSRVGRSIRPGSTSDVFNAANAVSRPVTPNGASSNGTSFSSRAWGAWSVAIASIVPSTRAAMSAERSSLVLSGGVMLRFAPGLRPPP